MVNCFSMFNILENPEYDSFFRTFVSRKFGEKEIVSDANTIENNVFAVLSGQLRVYLSSGGREFTLFFLDPGDVFTTHSKMIVEAKKPTEVFMTNIGNFMEGMTRIPALSVSVIATLCRGLGNAAHVIEGLVFYDVKSRLTSFILDIVDERGHKVDGGTVITLDHSIEDIAAIIGSTRQSASLILNELIRDGHITRLDRRHLVVHRPDALRELTGPRYEELSLRWGSVQRSRTQSSP
ncbi:MAG TPA: Crp/Fnr family transcriptional regulator [Phycisphaerae bacterium]|nr:Crp/Fnr family transcriptional regulator [Phycisphaerae bacterium]